MTAAVVRCLPGWALVVSSSERMYTLPVAVATFAIGQNATDYGLLMAGSTVLVLPVLIVFLAPCSPSSARARRW